MAFCKECGAQLSDHALFCGTCGARVRGQEEKRVCPNCGAEAPSHMIFCAQCGTRLAEAAAEDREQPARRTYPEDRSAAAQKASGPRETVLLWCCLGIGLISYLVQVLWRRPENLMAARVNIPLVILFALQTPCLLLSMTGLFHRRFSRKDWTSNAALRSRFLLAVAVIGSVLACLAAYQGERTAAERLIRLDESAAGVTIFITLHGLGLVCAALALALGRSDGLLHRKIIGVVTGLAGLFSLVNYFYLYTGVFWGIRAQYLVPSNYFMAPYQLTPILVIVWTLCCENLRRVAVRPALARLSVAVGAAAAIVLTAGMTQRTGGLIRLTGGALAELYINHRFYDPVLLPLGLLLVVLCGLFCFLTGRDAGQPGQGG